MKSYILTARIYITDENIQRARKWARLRGYDYKDKIAKLVFDHLTDGGKDMDIDSVEISECEKPSKKRLAWSWLLE